MKLVGFIKEYNDIDESVTLDSMLNSKYSNIDHNDRVIDYLNNGYLLLGWMGYFIDIKTKELIAPDAYYTDGIWVWPSYLQYYLKKYPNIEIDKEFLKYLNSKDFKFVMDSEFEQNKNLHEIEMANRLSSRR